MLTNDDSSNGTYDIKKGSINLLFSNLTWSKRTNYVKDESQEQTNPSTLEQFALENERDLISDLAIEGADLAMHHLASVVQRSWFFQMYLPRTRVSDVAIHNRPASFLRECLKPFITVGISIGNSRSTYAGSYTSSVGMLDVILIRWTAVRLTPISATG